MILEAGQVYAMGDGKTLEITRIVAFGNGRTLIYWKRENGETGESSAYDLAQQLAANGAVKIQAAHEQE
jgi:ubiquinone/menaquinone biosynthesis C-methylase UbiE